MNVYIAEVSRWLAQAGVEVEIFTRATSADLPPSVEMAPGVTVRHIQAGPYEGLSKEELPAQLCAFTTGVLRTEPARTPGYFDLVHSHYWLSGQAGWLAKDRWDVPLVHTAHTLAKVKNTQLAAGDYPEPKARVIGEEQVVGESDLLVSNTEAEARELIELYGADPTRISVVAPGVDLDRFSPGEKTSARRRLGLPENGHVLLFVGRIQALKAPDLLVRTLSELRARDPILAARTTLVIAGGNSGTGLDLEGIVDSLGLENLVRRIPPQRGAALTDLYRAADLVGVPSHNESFGLVALEAQACGIPVIATKVGGLTTAVRDGISGVLLDSRQPADWARIIGGLLRSPARRAQLAAGAVEHARDFSWARTAQGLLDGYRDALGRHRSELLEVA